MLAMSALVFGCRTCLMIMVFCSENACVFERLALRCVVRRADARSCVLDARQEKRKIFSVRNASRLIVYTEWGICTMKL